MENSYEGYSKRAATRATIGWLFVIEMGHLPAEGEL
jgi:hypothetical protein